jgi:general secretion pathway protein D
VVRFGQRMRRYLSLHAVSRSLLLLTILSIVAACNQFVTGADHGSVTGADHGSVTGADHGSDPDVFERIRSLDLTPRFPREVDPPQNLANRIKPAVYNGGAVPALSTPSDAIASSGDGYELNFENTPITSIAKVVLGDIMGVGYSIDPRVQGTVSLSSARPVPKSDMIYVLENAVRLGGVALLKDTSGYRLVPLADAVGAGSLDRAGAEPGYGVSVVPLQHVSAPTLIKLLDSFATRPGTVRADTTRNLLLIQGTGPERRVAIETALSFDVDWMRGQSVGIYPVQNSNPEPIITELEKIMDSGDGGLNQNAVKFQPVARMNAVLVVTRKSELLKAAGTWIQRLDNADTSRTGVHVYHLKYGDARQMAGVLNNVFVGGNNSSLDTAASQIAPGSGLSATTNGGLGANQSGFGTNQSGFGGNQQAGAGTQQFGGGNTARTGFGGTPLGAQPPNANGTAAADLRNGGAGGSPILPGVRITADVVSNTLLIYASQENYRMIERTLVQLDRPQMQVAIDATVAEVDLNDSLSYGVQAFLQSSAGSISNIPSSPPGVASTNVAGLVGAALNRAFPGFNFLVGSETNPKLILDALHAVTDVKILSNPSLVVIDNQVATLTVGSDVPITTGSANVLNSATASSNTIVNTIDYRSVGIILRVVPRINNNGTVRLDIEQEISQISNASTSSTSTPNLTPTVSERKVKSSIAVTSGQTVLLAGLIQEQKEVDRSGIPLLDQIPHLGDAFSHQSKSTTRTELIIFIRPQIIRDSVDAHYLAEELRTKLRGSVGVAGSGASPSNIKSR